MEQIAATTTGLNSLTRNLMREAINSATHEWQEEAREQEQERAIDALTAAGFVLDDEDGETWTRGPERAVIEILLPAESTYRWSYESQDNGTHPLYRYEEGKSGDFHRLIALIGAEVKAQ